MLCSVLEENSYLLKSKKNACSQYTRIYSLNLQPRDRYSFFEAFFFIQRFYLAPENENKTKKTSR